MIAEEIKQLIGREVRLEHPANLTFGDYAFHAGAEAEALAAKINDAKPEWLERAEPVRGFVNLFLSPKFFLEAIGRIIAEKEAFGRSEKLINKKVIIEYTNTNVLKPMHIGHLMGNVIGEALSRLIESQGAEVKRNTYQGDVGLHIAKALWGLEKLGGPTGTNLDEPVEFIGKAYALGSEAYETEETTQTEIKEINKKLYEKTDTKLLELYAWGRKVSLEHFEELYQKLGTKFDYYFFESEVAEAALKIVGEFLTQGIFTKSDGAIVFEGERFEPTLHTRVFVTKQGIPTYEAKDVAHALRKYQTFAADESIIITANEQNGYFKVVLRALREIDKNVAERTRHLSHGMLKLPSGKMSSRRGNIITGEALLADIREKLGEHGSDEIAVGAIKYSILRQSPGRDIIFDFDKSLSFEGDSGPYLQYACVRAKSVLARADKPLRDTAAPATISPVEKLLYRFPEVVERAAADYAPNYLVTYLTDLASAFNSYYAANKIIGSEEEGYRLALTAATAQVLENGLNLLGIKVPEKM